MIQLSLSYLNIRPISVIRIPPLLVSWYSAFLFILSFLFLQRNLKHLVLTESLIPAGTERFDVE